MIHCPLWPAPVCNLEKLSIETIANRDQPARVSVDQGSFGYLSQFSGIELAEFDPNLTRAFRNMQEQYLTLVTSYTELGLEWE